MTMTSVDHGEPYFLKADISKAGQSSASINDYIKMRVADNGKILPVQWYDQGRVMNVNGMIPFMEGAVGQWHTDDDDNIVMAPDADYRDWQGSAANTRDGGWADYILTDQMFTQKGIFYGKIGLMDGNGRRLTSIDIWFRVLGDDAMFGLTGKYYSDRVEKLIRQIEDKTDQVIGEARDAYKQDLKASHDASIATQAALDKTKATADQLAIAIGQQQDYINARNIVTIKDFDALSDKVTKYVTDNFVQPTAYDSLDALKATYPSGAKGIFVTIDTGHFYIFENNTWKDCGIFQSAGIADKSISIEKLTDTLQGSYYADVSELKIDHVNTGYMDGDQSGKIITETEDTGIDPVHTDIISVSPGEEYYVTTQSYWNGRAVNFLKDGTFVKALPEHKDTQHKYVKITIPSNINGVVLNGTRTFPPRIFKVNSYTQISDAMNSFTPLLKAQEYNFEQISLAKRGAFGYWNKNWGGFLEVKADPTRAQIGYEPVKVKPLEVYRISGCSKWDARLWIVIDYEGKVVDYCSIEDSDNLTETIVIPRDGAYLEINELMLNTVTKLEKAISIKSNLPLSGKKWTAIGDSWTQIHSDKNQSYVDYVSQITGVTAQNAGAGGTGYVTGGPDNWNNQFFKRSIDANANLVTVFGSFNDAYDSNFKFGKQGDTDTNTLWGALKATLDHIYSLNFDAQVGVIAPGPWGAINQHLDATIKMSTLGTHSDSKVNDMSIVDFAEKYVQILQDFAKLNSLPFLDLYHYSGLRPWDSTFINKYYHGTNDTDTTHPNSEAMKKFIAPKVAEFIKSFA